MIEHELQQIVTSIPEVSWIRIIHFDGLTYHNHRFDSESIKRDTADLEEDRFGAMSVATLSLAERVSAELVLGNSFLAVITGEMYTHFFLPLGDGKVVYLVCRQRSSQHRRDPQIL